MNAKVQNMLIELASADYAHRKWNTLDAMGELVEEEPTSPRSKKDSEFLSEYGFDKEARRYAVLALGNLAITPFSHLQLMTEKCVSALSNSLDCPDDETRFNAAFAFNKLSIEEANSKYLGECGCIPKLVDVVMTGTSEAKAQAVAVMRHLANRSENRFFILQANALDPLGELGISAAEEKETMRELSALVCLLTLSDGLRLPVVSSKLLSPILTLCQHNDVEIARHACAAIANLAESKRTHKQLAGGKSKKARISFCFICFNFSCQYNAYCCISNAQ
jgi:hypothetical protein